MRGTAALFFVAAILPLLFLLFTLSVDLGTYYRTQQKAQVVVDEAVLQGARMLPNRTRAERATRAYLDRFSELTQAAQVLVESDSVVVNLSGTTPLSFAQYFIPDIGVPFTAYATARVDPVDVYIAVDTSQRVAPRAESETDVFLDQGLASTFFEYDFPVIQEGVAVDPRFLTARCFNSLFSSLKRAAINIHDYLAAFRLNAVGMGVFPALEGIKDVRPITLVDEVVQSGQAEGLFPFYVSLHGASSWCAAATQFERVNLESFSFPQGSSGIESHFDAGPASIELATNNGEINSDYLSHLGASEALWSAVAHEELSQTDVVVREIASRLSSPDYLARGGLRNRAQQLGIILTADLPWARMGGEAYRFGDHPQVEEKLRDALSMFRILASQTPAIRFQLLYVVLLHAPYRDAIMSRRFELEQVFSEVVAGSLGESVSSNLTIRLIVVERPEEAMREVSTAIALAGRQAIVSR